jgi:2,4-dienoyl-CoA reductase [(3E)-enoyl-CoA-producing], peroxisomal
MDILTPKADSEKDNSSRIPLGRQGSVKDVADATVYLLSDAGNYVNGDVLLGEFIVV